MTIEERAEQLATHRVYDNDGEHICIDNGEKSMYIGVLKEQREIDIQRAVEWYCNKCKWAKSCAMCNSKDTCSKIKELKQAIKGE